MIKHLQNGPITCAINANPANFSYWKGDEIYTGAYTTNVADLDHEISVVGYGVENDVNYWFVRNSWGTFWGDNGFFKVESGKNSLGIELDCSWASVDETPLIVHNTKEVEEKPQLRAYNNVQNLEKRAGPE
jgi:cathepsin X